jgi:glycosyltransferase involved in cell wall biosynthesis
MLRDALASIRALESSDVSFEIIIGDNGATTARQVQAIAAEFGARYVAAPRRGASCARNVGLQAATGEFVAFLDDDDAWLPTHLNLHIAVLDARPDLDGVFGQFVYTDEHLRPREAPLPEDMTSEPIELLRRMLSGFFPQIGTLVVRKGTCDYIGLFDEALIGGQDLDWMLRIARAKRLGFVKTPSVLFRSRPRVTFDALQRRRVWFDRRVFLTHAIPEWRIWRSPLDFMRAYDRSIAHFYSYWVEAAEARAERGDRKGVLEAVWGAFLVFQARTLFHLVAGRPLFRAVAVAFFGRRRSESACS